MQLTDDQLALLRAIEQATFPQPITDMANTFGALIVEVEELVRLGLIEINKDLFGDHYIVISPSGVSVLA